MFLSLNILNISGCKAVSLFNTRGKSQIADVTPLAGKHADLNSDILTDLDNNLTDSNLDSEFFTDNENTLIDRTLDDGNFAYRRNTFTDRISFMEYNDLSDNVANDSDNNAYYDTDMGIEKNSDTDKMDSDKVSDTETEMNSDFDLKSNTFNVTDNKYLAGKKKIRTIFWKYIIFYIVRSPVRG